MQSNSLASRAKCPRLLFRCLACRLLMAELEKLHEECKADPKQVVHGHTGLRNEEAAPAVMLSVKLEVSLPRLLGFVQALQPQVWWRSASLRTSPCGHSPVDMADQGNFREVQLLKP